MSVDLRRFDYALEPLLRRRRWQLEALTAELGRVQRCLQEGEERAAELHEQLQVDSERVALGLMTRVDPAGHPRALGWLVQLRNSIHASEQAVEELRGERDRTRAACVAQQQRVDVIERHRQDCLAEYAQEEAARAASEADRDWLSRRVGMPGGPIAREGA